MSTRTVADARRWLAFHSVGTYELLMEIQGSLEDFLGAARDGRRAVAVFAARVVVLRSLAIRALAVDGGVPDFEDPYADPFAGVEAGKVAHGLGLIRAVANQTGAIDVTPVVEYVREFERELGFAEPPGSVRRPEGLFPALRLARELLPLNQESGFPIALPAAWSPNNRPPEEPS